MGPGATPAGEAQAAAGLGLGTCWAEQEAGAGRAQEGHSRLFRRSAGWGTGPSRVMAVDGGRAAGVGACQTHPGLPPPQPLPNKERRRILRRSAVTPPERRGGHLSSPLPRCPPPSPLPAPRRAAPAFGWGRGGSIVCSAALLTARPTCAPRFLPSDSFEVTIARSPVPSSLSGGVRFVKLIVYDSFNGLTLGSQRACSGGEGGEGAGVTPFLGSALPGIEAAGNPGLSGPGRSRSRASGGATLAQNKGNFRSVPGRDARRSAGCARRCCGPSGKRSAPCFGGRLISTALAWRNRCKKHLKSAS